MLDGKIALVLEEEFLIALDIQRVLETLGASQTLFARTLEEAQTVVLQRADIGLAIIEVRADASPCLALANMLIKENVGVVLSTAEIPWSRGLPQLPEIPVVTKPMVESDLVAAIKRALSPKA